MGTQHARQPVSLSKIAEKKPILYIQVNHMIGKPENVNAEAGENLEKAEFIFMVDLKTLIHKASVDPKLRQLKICQRKNEKQ